MLLMTLGYWFLYQEATDEFQAAVRYRQEFALREARQILRNRLAVAANDIRFMAANPVLKRYLASGADDDRRFLEALFSDLMAARRNQYDQLRYLDETGMEVVRINNGAQGAEIVPPRELQNKRQRYYFARSVGLPLGDVYLSPFDLNIEHGQVELPHKPTLRLGARAADAEGQPRGALVLNYLGSGLIDPMHAIGGSVGMQFWLANKDGYWLIGPDADEEWRFMFPGRPGGTVADRYPELWRQMRDLQGEAHLDFDEHGDLLAVAAFAPEADRASETGVIRAEAGTRWYLIANFPQEAAAVQERGLVRRYVLSYIAVALALTGLVAGLAVIADRRRLAVEALAQREQDFRILLEAAPDAMIVTDAEGRIIMANAQVEESFGRPRAGLVGQSIEVLLPDRFHASHRSQRAGYIANPVPRAMGEGRELFGCRGDGSEFPVSVALNAFDGQEGKRVICVVRDVTEAHRTGLALRQALAQSADGNRALQAANRELESFSYSVSHDLRAPLRAVDGFSNILLKSYAEKLDEDGRDLLLRMRAAAQRMGQLIDDMLVLSRITRSELALQTVDLSALVAEAVAHLQESFPERRIQVTIQPGVKARADPRLIRIVLDNLLGNAWKFTGKTPEARVEFGCEELDGHREYFIRDNGAGFDMAYADKLFGAFQRLHSASDFPGSGIGLATVVRIIHRHGGDVRAEGEVGQGAAFWFSLPS